MTIRNLQTLLKPESVALIGASVRPGSIGATVMEKMRGAGFAGRIYAVNPHRVEAPGIAWAPRIADLPDAPDLAIVMVPPQAVPAVIAELGAMGNRLAVVLSAGLTAANGLRQKMLDAARPHCLRIIGPNCLGVMMPHAGLDATFARTRARPGGLALVSQSGALVTAILDWAESRDIGFSGVVSAGDMADVDLGDLIDLFAVDPETDAILLYVEGVTNAAKFMSAARAAARGKPVIAIKAGRSPDAAKAALSHTGALAGAYDVYRAAFERAGIVVVETLTELFDAAEILCVPKRVKGDRLAIVTNGGGAGILAVDALKSAGASLAMLTDETVAALDAVLPPTWSRANPVDVIGDAGPDRYGPAIDAVLADPGVDAVLVMNCPTATADSIDVAATVVERIEDAARRGIDKPVLACWLGDDNCASARGTLRKGGVALYGTPNDAVRGFGYLLAARRAGTALNDTSDIYHEIRPDRRAAKAILAGARAAGRTMLDEVEAKALLDAYRIPVVATRFAPDVEAVAEACAQIDPPYAVKIVSPQLTHKSDVGGVALHLPDREAAVAAARAMGDRIRKAHPDAELRGFAVEAMCVRPHALELIAGIATDPTFGPILMVGAGGKAVEVLDDKALALPPIDEGRAEAMIGGTRISRLLGGYRDEPPADRAGVAGVIEALSAMIVDMPDIVELDINPLLVDARGVVALDARVRITPEPRFSSTLVIRPAPMEWSADLTTKTGYRFHVRPVRSDDEPLLSEFFAHVSPEDLRFRFLTSLKTIGHDQLSQMTRVDYRRTMTFLAFDPDGAVIATAMLAADPDRIRAEVALATRADRKRRGISWTLFAHVLRYARAEGIREVEAIERADHLEAIRMEREMGFTAETDPDDSTMRIVRRVLTAAAAE